MTCKEIMYCLLLYWWFDCTTADMRTKFPLGRHCYINVDLYANWVALGLDTRLTFTGF